MVGKPDPDRFDDLFAAFGKITLRRMFGGEGLYRDDVIFGIVFDERIYLKTSEEGRQAFIAEGSAPFVYPMKKGDITSHNYYALPDRLYDDPDELAEWARAAVKAASVKKKNKTVADRAAKKPTSKKRKRPAKRRR